MFPSNLNVSLDFVSGNIEILEKQNSLFPSGPVIKCYYLGRRGREGWRELTKNSLEFKHDDQNKEYITIKHTEQTKNNQGGSKQKDQDYTDVRMYGLPGSSMDPISSLKLMLSKLHPDCEALFQTPLTKFSKAAECWYKNEPLGKNSIAQLMPKISKKAGLSQVYTAHCVRASTITRLHQAGIDAKQICAIKKHKNEQSLTSYIKDSSASQKRACSDILKADLHGTTLSHTTSLRQAYDMNCFV